MIDTNDYEQYNMTTSPYNKTRKFYLAKQGLIKCDRIPYERKNNKSRLNNRESIRRYEVIDE